MTQSVSLFDSIAEFRGAPGRDILTYLEFSSMTFFCCEKSRVDATDLSQRDMGPGVNMSTASWTAAETCCQLKLIVFQRALLWDAEVTGTSHRMGRWSESRPSGN